VNVSIAFFILISIKSIGQNTPIKLPLKHQVINLELKTRVSKLINKKDWNILFPHRFGIGQKDSIYNNPDFYSYTSFLEAASLFPSFLSEGDVNMQKVELSAFLANIAQETSGGWDSAPGGYYKWGLYFTDEQNLLKPNGYIDLSKKFPAVQGKKYYGRGPKQISWNYNYGQFSEFWYGSKDTLLEHPEYLSKYPIVSFASAIWFWMTPQFPKPSCHDIMIYKWIPTLNDLTNGRLPGFGATINVINGGVECGSGTDLQKTQYRYNYYRFFLQIF